MEVAPSRSHKLSFLLVIIAGETIFMLPFLLPRLLRPLMLEVWGITNTDIGLAFSAYGITAMVSYFLGGSFADRYPPKELISISLFSTALAGLFLLLNPTPSSLVLIYSFFGVSTTFLMWSALIKYSHNVGGTQNRATAMGFLDAGRGLIAAVMSSLLLVVISYTSKQLGSSGQDLQTLNASIGFIVGFILLMALLVYFVATNPDVSGPSEQRWELKKVPLLLKNDKVWLLGLIILCSYCGYKNIDNYSIYLVDVKQVSLKQSALLTSVIFWLRPLAALLAGLSADRLARTFKISNFFLLFGLLTLGGISQLILGLNVSSSFLFIFTVILGTSAFVYALRAIYFAVFEDLRIPNTYVGTTIGIASLVGFLPDVFFGTVTGHIIDSNPGAPGYNTVFVLTGIALLVGALASLVIDKRLNS